MQICVLADVWRAHPLVWIHRAEARSVAAELRHAGHDVRLTHYRPGSSLPPGAPLLRLFDPVMLRATRELTDAGQPYIGPAADVLERCYDKAAASHLADQHGIDTPSAPQPGRPFIVKPRRGSDSIGIRLLRGDPARYVGGGHLVQEHVRGFDVTVAVLRGQVGMPLRVMLPEGQPYTFLRKYLLRPSQAPFPNQELVEAAAKIAGLFRSNWAARIDFIVQPESGRLCFLECDAAPLIGERSAFAASLAAAGCARAQQLELLLAAGA